MLFHPRSTASEMIAHSLSTAAALLLFAACLAVAANHLSAAEAAGHPLHVSTPLALAQTGLNGTFMSLGCEYNFDPGARKPQARYVVIVKNGKGKTVGVSVKLEEHGMAAMFIDGWRPDDRPFSGYFAEQIDSPSTPNRPEFRPISDAIDFPLDPNQQ